MIRVVHQEYRVVTQPLGLNGELLRVSVYVFVFVGVDKEAVLQPKLCSQGAPLFI